MTASVIAGFAACLVAVGALITWVTAATFDRERDRVEDGLLALAESQAAEMGTLFDSAVPLIDDIAANSALAAMDAAACRQALAPLRSVSSSARLVIVGADGRAVCALSGDRNEPVPAGTVAEALDRNETVTDADVFIDEVSGHPAVALAAPISGPRGRVGAVVCVLFTDVPSLRLPAGAHRGTTVVAIDPDTDLVAATTPDSPYKAGAAVSWTDPPRIDGDGVERIWRAAVEPATGWRFLVGLDVDLALAAAREERETLLGFGAAIFVLVAALALALHRRIARPIRRLGSAIAASRPGDTARQAPESGPTEVVEVARAFNALLESHTGLVTRLKDNACHDPLTGLLNRRGANEELTRVLASPTASDLSVLFIDLDRFKLVNDSHGHTVGDHLLVQLARRIEAAVPQHWIVTRFGGDEFVILCPDTPNPVPAVEDLAKLLRGTFRIDALELSVGGSIGIARAQAGTSGEDLIRQADTAMYRAKEAGRGRWAEFDEPMRAMALDRLVVEAELRGAAARGELVLYYQPLVHLATGRTTGVEALIRWQHPTRGLLAPGAFLPVAEDTDLILEIGRWVAGEACRRAAAWRAAGTPTRVSINVSAAELLRTNVIATIAGALAEAGALAADLVVEVTESAVLSDIEWTVVQLEALRTLGVTVVLDDFGTGFSSLSHLRQLPADELKIDRTFVAELGRNPVCDAIVTSLITMAHAIDMLVVGEGVETEEQRAHLARLGCDLGQGYLLGRPADEDAVSLPELVA